MPKNKGGPWRWLKDSVLEPGFGRRLDFLGGIPLFSGIPRRRLTTLLQALSCRDYQKNEPLCQADAIGHFLFIIESGAVAVLQKDKSGHERRVATLGSGDFFGEVSVLTDSPRTATVKALEPVRAYLLYKTELEKLISDEPAIGANIALKLAQLLAARLIADRETRETPS